MGRTGEAQVFFFIRENIIKAQKRSRDTHEVDKGLPKKEKRNVQENH